MSRDWATRVLSAHADQLNRGAANDARASAESAELESLMRTAARAKQALTPLELPAAFRARLRDGLTMAARHSESQKIMLGRRDPAWGWVIGAAALGSAAGLIAIAWRARHLQRSLDSARIAPPEQVKVAQESKSLAG